MSDYNGSSQTFVAGFGDGSVKVFDRRLDDEDAVVRSYSEHASWVQNVRWYPRTSGQIMSARSVFQTNNKEELLTASLVWMVK